MLDRFVCAVVGGGLAPHERAALRLHGRGGPSRGEVPPAISFPLWRSVEIS
jgi:hypothetical protein